jgi:hypothetical protein
MNSNVIPIRERRSTGRAERSYDLVISGGGHIEEMSVVAKSQREAIDQGIDLFCAAHQIEEVPDYFSFISRATEEMPDRFGFMWDRAQQR